MTNATNDRPDITIGELSEQWLGNVKFRIKESSYVKYQGIIKNHILPEIGDVQLSKFTTAAAEQFIENRLKNGKKDGSGLSEKTVRDILILLREIITFGTMQDLEIHCRLDLIKVRVHEPEIIILDEEEQRRLENYIDAHRDSARTGILLSLYMGLRLGEVCALRREHILYESRTLRVRGTMQRIQNISREGTARTKVIISTPKSSASRRDIPIPDFLMDYLIPMENNPPKAYLLTGRIDSFIEPRTLENIFQNCLRDCRISKINYHALRHTFATRCVENGFDIKSLSEILGHTSVNITLNRYVHSSMDLKRKQMNQLVHPIQSAK